MLIDPQALDVLRSAALAIAGFLAKVLWDGVRGKMRTLRYTVMHQRVAQGADDPVFGTVAVTWKGNPVANLWLSTVRLENRTLHDFENLDLFVYSATKSLLLAERRSIVGSTRIPHIMQKFQESLHVPEGQQPTTHQVATYYHRREYAVTVFNRGEVAEFTYLVNQGDDAVPRVWLEAQGAGVRVKEVPFRTISPFILGVSVFEAFIPGLLISALLIVASSLLIDSLPLVALIAFIVGLASLAIGAAAVWLYRRAKVIFFH